MDNSKHLERHYANREDLLTAGRAAAAKWEAEMDALRDRRDANMALFDQGLKDIEAVIVEAGGKTLAEAAAHVEPVEPEPAPDPEAPAAPVEPPAPAA